MQTFSLSKKVILIGVRSYKYSKTIHIKIHTVQKYINTYKKINGIQMFAYFESISLKT